MLPTFGRYVLPGGAAVKASGRSHYVSTADPPSSTGNPIVPYQAEALLVLALWLSSRSPLPRSVELPPNRRGNLLRA